jgi:hypothetical protein
MYYAVLLCCPAVLCSAACLVALQAKVTQQANMMANKRSAPIWALAAIMFLGWNEFMAVLWNPVLLVVGLFTCVFGYQMYNELDVDAELQRGWVMGAMNIWAKLGDVVKQVRGLPQGMQTNQGLGPHVWMTSRACTIKKELTHSLLPQQLTWVC